MRQIYIVNATQVVTSDSHPEGMFSVVNDYPKNFDSRNFPLDGDPNGDEAKALRAAKAEYYSRLSANYASDTRVMWTVTLERADGRQILTENKGGFPDIKPEPEPDTEPEPEQSGEEQNE